MPAWFARFSLFWLQNTVTGQHLFMGLPKKHSAAYLQRKTRIVAKKQIGEANMFPWEKKKRQNKIPKVQRADERRMHSSLWAAGRDDEQLIKPFQVWESPEIRFFFKIFDNLDLIVLVFIYLFTLIVFYFCFCRFIFFMEQHFDLFINCVGGFL